MLSESVVRQHFSVPMINTATTNSVQGPIAAAININSSARFRICFIDFENVAAGYPRTSDTHTLHPASSNRFLHSSKAASEILMAGIPAAVILNRGTSVIRVIVSASSKYASNESPTWKG